ncbi:MAG: flippase-like domain-containing protein [Bacteroidetes bacterium]|nr:flippase-like domain-containing protein [Bacteroidota bacterium]
MSQRTDDFRHWAVWIGKLLLAVLLLVLLLHNLHRETLLSTLSAARPLYIGAALLLLIPNVFLQYRKWRVLLHSVYPTVTAHDTRASLLLGFTFGIVTPARIGEFGGRAVAVRGADKLTLMGLTALDKLATLLVTVTAGAFGLLLFCLRHPFMDPLLLAGIEITVLAVAFVLLRLRAARRSSSRTDTPRKKGRSRVQQLREALRRVDAPVRKRLLLLSLLFYGTFLLQFIMLLLAFGPVDPLSAIAGISTIMLIKTIIPPVTLGELGIREGASVYVLGHAGILATAAFSASLLLFAINILLPSLAGLLILLRRPAQESTA